MKNLLKRATLVVAMMLVTSASILLVGCGEEKTHTHSLTKVDAVEATCETAGNIEYWYCADCGKYYSDEDATTEISQEDTVIAATGHTLTHYVSVEATCETAGNIEYWYCADCGKYFSDAEGTVVINQEDTVIAATGHTLTHYVRVEATCETAGNIEYWYCADCGKYFSNAEGTVVINQEDTVVIGHIYSEGLFYNSTDKKWYTKCCSLCGSYSEEVTDGSNLTFAVSSSNQITSAIGYGAESVVLSSDIELAGSTMNSIISKVAENGSLTIDLNGYVLTLKATGAAINISKNKTITIKDSSVEDSAVQNTTPTLKITNNGNYFIVNGGSRLNLENLVISKTNASSTDTGIVKVNAGTEEGVSSYLNITGCNITSVSTYIVSTNSSTTYDGDFTINIEDSYLECKKTDSDSTPVLINIAGTLNIKDSTIVGQKQALVVRAGTANVEDSTITCVLTYSGSEALGYTTASDITAWSSGNDIALGAIVVGSYSSSGYEANAVLNIKNSTVSCTTGDESLSDYTYAIFAIALNTAGEGYTTSITVENITVTGKTYIANESDTYNNGNVTYTDNSSAS